MKVRMGDEYFLTNSDSKEISLSHGVYAEVALFMKKTKLLEYDIIGLFQLTGDRKCAANEEAVKSIHVSSNLDIMTIIIMWMMVNDDTDDANANVMTGR